MKWNHTFDIKEDWKKASKREISVRDFSKLLAERIAKSSFFNDHDRELIYLITEFERFEYLDKTDATWEDFDRVWDLFYNWADENRVWIRTF